MGHGEKIYETPYGILTPVGGSHNSIFAISSLSAVVSRDEDEDLPREEEGGGLTGACRSLKCIAEDAVETEMSISFAANSTFPD